MKHATPETIDKLASKLDRIRSLGVLKEKKKGTFYNKSSAFLHFHEDVAGLFADLKVNNIWQRFEINNDNDWEVLLAKVIEIFKR